MTPLRLLPILALLAIGSNAFSQVAAPTREQLKSWLTIRQQRVDLLRDEIKQTDSRIESRMDEIVHA
jgi:hypothetical protein